MTTINNESLTKEKIEAAEQAWNDNSILYKQYFHNLIDRLPSNVYTWFKGFGFHDYHLEKLNFNHTSLFHTDIDLILMNDGACWKLSFTEVSNFKFSHLNHGNPCPIFDPTLDS